MFAEESPRCTLLNVWSDVSKNDFSDEHAPMISKFMDAMGNFLPTTSFTLGVK